MGWDELVGLICGVRCVAGWVGTSRLYWDGGSIAFCDSIRESSWRRDLYTDWVVRVLPTCGSIVRGDLLFV